MDNLRQYLSKSTHFQQSYLLISPQKSIQMEMAKILSTKILQLDPDQIETHPDIVWYTPQTHEFGISLIRTIIRQISLKPYMAKSKATVIHQAGELTLEAQNALLKTLEEPPNNSIIILTANHTDNLLPTILSRCLIFDLGDQNNQLEQTTEIPESLQKILTSPYLYQKFQTAASIHKEELIPQTLIEWTKYLVQELHSHKYDENPKILYNLTQNLELLEKAIELEKSTNTNKLMILENVILNLKTLK